MSIKIACTCGKRFIAPPQLAGKSVNCPACGSKIAIAAPPTSSPATPALARPAPARVAVATPADEGIVVSCLCGQHFKAPSHLAGQQLPCPVCQQPILIPSAMTGLAPQSAAEPPLTSNDLWNELPPQTAFPSAQTQLPQPSWPPPTPQASPQSAIAHQYMADAYRQDVEKRQDMDVWGNGQIYSGIITMTIAAIWFCSGLLVGIIFFFPPVMFIGGAIALINGISQRVNRS